MILLKLIRKEVRQFFRNKTDVITMFIFPIVLIVVMGIALNGLMNVETNIFENKVVTFNTNNLSNDENYLKVFNQFKDSFEDLTNVKFKEYNNADVAKSSVDKGESMIFIDITDENYSIYRSDNKETNEQKIFTSIFQQYIKKYILSEIVLSENKEILSDILNEESNIVLSKEGINRSGINSFTYYTFAELVLIILYISTITSISMYKESYLSTISRLKSSNVSYLSVILSKSILGMIIGIIQIAVVYFVSTKFLNVSWGENITQIVLILSALIFFSSSLGVFSSLIFREQKTSAIVSNIIIIIMGFLGGSYMPISLIKSIPITNVLCHFTPTYWANISLLSISTNINTIYPQISLFVSLGLSFIMIFTGLILNRIRVGGRF